MSVDDLFDAVWKDNEEEVLRLIDEEDVNMNGRNRVSFFLSFLDDLGLVE